MYVGFLWLYKTKGQLSFKLSKFLQAYDFMKTNLVSYQFWFWLWCQQFAGFYLIRAESVTVPFDEPVVPSRAEIIPLEADTDYTGVGRLQRLPWSFYYTSWRNELHERNTSSLPKKNR